MGETPNAGRPGGRPRVIAGVAGFCYTRWEVGGRKVGGPTSFWARASGIFPRTAEAVKAPDSWAAGCPPRAFENTSLRS